MAETTFRENVAIVTGASRGIGREIALQMADQGAWLSLGARNVTELEEVADLCRKRGGKALVVQTDVADRAQCQRLIEQTVAEYGRIDTLFNNAGITMWCRIDELEDFALAERIMQVNFYGSVYCTRYALPYLKQTHGRVVGISSLMGKTGVPTRSIYVASKHAMAGFFNAIRIELMGDGVTVTVIYPSFVATGIRTQSVDLEGKSLGKTSIQEDKTMSVEECVRQTLSVVAARKRELIMTPRGKIVEWLKLIVPGMVDNIARRAIEKGR